MQLGRIGGYLIISQFILVVVGIVWYPVLRLDPAARRNMFYVLFVMAMNATFADFIEQYGLTIILLFCVT
jgi:hypothetical protein